MVTDGAEPPVISEYAAATHSAALVELLGGSARSIKERQAETESAEQRAREEREAFRRRLAREQSRMRKQLNAEYRAELTRAERLADMLRPLRRLQRPSVIVSVMLAVVAMLAALVGRGSVVLALFGALFLAALAIGRKVLEARAERITPEHAARVHKQLDRVLSTLFFSD
jgi:hypothetical protein